MRTSIGRDPNTTDLASGFQEVLAELAQIGYKQIEFAGYRQNVNAPGGADLGTVAGAQLLRGWLDANGLEAEGNHGDIPSHSQMQTNPAAALASFDAACEVANILGMSHVGTGNDSTSVGVALRPIPRWTDWQKAAARWNTLGERAMTVHGLKLYTHNRHRLQPPAGLRTGRRPDRPTRSSGVRRPRVVHQQHRLALRLPGDGHLLAHVAQVKHTSYTAADGTVVTDVFDPLGTVNSFEPCAIHCSTPRTATGRTSPTATRSCRSSRRHRLREVPGRGRRQGLPTTDVGAGQRRYRSCRDRPPERQYSFDNLAKTARLTCRSCCLHVPRPGPTGARLVRSWLPGRPCR